jgi:hypothetical protein
MHSQDFPQFRQGHIMQGLDVASQTTVQRNGSNYGVYNFMFAIFAFYTRINLVS